MVMSLISKSDETAYRSEVLSLVDWCNTNNLELSVSKNKKLLVDFCSAVGNTTYPLSSTTVKFNLWTAANDWE